VRPHIEQRLRERRTKPLPRLHTIQKLAERLAAEEEADSNYEAYALQLLQLVATDGQRIGRLFSQSLPLEAQDFDYMLLVAAAFTNQTTLLASLMDSDQSWGSGTALGQPFEAAATAGNYQALAILFQRMKCSAHVLQIAIHNGDHPLVKHMLNLEFTSVDPWHNWHPHSDGGDRRKMSRGEQSSYLETPSIEIFELMRSELRRRWLAKLDTELLRDLLTSAAVHGRTDMVKHLIQCGAPLDRPVRIRKLPRYALWCACKNGHEEVVQVLLQNGAKPRPKEFEIATTHGHASTLKLLLETEAAAQPHFSKGCLYAAARKGFADIVQLLLDYGVDPNDNDTAPLIGAVESEHTAMFRMLVQRGAVSSEILSEAKKRAEAEGLESMLVLLREAQSCAASSPSTSQV